MQRGQFVLAAMSPAVVESFSPIQIQKLLFVLDENVPAQTGGPYFNFQPYDYGPFDKAVYEELDQLRSQDLVEVSGTGWQSFRQYGLTGSGFKQGERFFKELPDVVQPYIIEVVEFVRSLSFAELVSAIYSAYPEMRENSVFQED